MKRKICVVTGTRAEYGLLYWLLKEISDDDELELQLIATGSHLSPEFGLTYKEIENDGFTIDKKIEILLSSDTSVGVSKSMGLAIMGLAEVYEELKPDIVVVLGDRYEILAAASAAMIARIPIAHLHGGEATEGAIDEAVRHSVTKMSHLHFTATDEYKKRVVQLGENPDRVFNFGGLGIDNIKKLKLLNREEFENAISFKLNKKNLLVTYHPATLDNITPGEQFDEIIKVIDAMQDVNILFTKPNADMGGREISTIIDDYVVQHPDRAISFISMGQLRYLSALQFVDAVVGNSSSGIIETPSFKTGTINIGDRQKGRIMAGSIINCEPKAESIHKAFEQLYSPEFQNKLKNTINPYGEGGASARIKQVLKDSKLDNVLKKKFYDL